MEVLDGGKRQLWNVVVKCGYMDCEATLKIRESDVVVTGYQESAIASITCCVCHRSTRLDYTFFGIEQFRRMKEHLPSQWGDD